MRSGNRVPVEMTPAQWTMLRTLISEEAMRLGYGRAFSPDAPRLWPERLRKLRTIDRQIRTALYPDARPERVR